MVERTTPYLFDEFFASGKEETISPFLTPSSRRWGRDLPLKRAFLAGIVLAIAFVSSFFHATLSQLLLLPVFFLVGTPALIAAIEDLQNFEINIDILMTVAAILSLFIGSGMEGALLLVLFELSGALEQSVTRKTQSALTTLHELAPKYATVMKNDRTVFQKALADIPIGTHLLIQAGEVVPLDGRVIEGSSFVNLVHLTGESQPVNKTIGDELLAGTLNIDGSFVIEVTRTTQESTLSRIIQLITQASQAKPKLQKLLDRFGKWYALAIMGLSLFSALFLTLIGAESPIYRSLSFLIAASPCALILATPTAYLSAISSCARRGILLKGGAILDALASCHAVAFDKTGTLTTGELHCSQFVTLQQKTQTIDETSALGIAASLEQHATHPIAKAICRFAQERNIPLPPIKQFKTTPGQGVEGLVQLPEGIFPVYIGNASFIQSQLSDPLNTSFTTLLLVGNNLYGLTFADTLRPEAISLIKSLKKQTLILSGDQCDAVKKVAADLGIDQVFGDLKPEDKLNKVAELSRTHGLVMVGDGMNDAPALARATVGISMGKIGSRTAIEASDVVLLNDDLLALPWLLNKAHSTLNIVKQNLALALGVIAVASLSALAGFIPLWLAVVLHEGGSVVVGLNSLRLLRKS